MTGSGPEPRAPSPADAPATGFWSSVRESLSGTEQDFTQGSLNRAVLLLSVILPAWGVANAAATLVGQNLGARRPDRAERAVWVTGAWNMAFMAVVTVIFVAFAEVIVAPFSADAETTAVGTRALRIISYGYVFYAWGMVMLQAFNGAGDTATPTKINFFVFWLFQIPLAWVLAHTLGVGPDGVFWAIALAYSLSAVVGVFLFRGGKWKEKEV